VQNNAEQGTIHMQAVVVIAAVIFNEAQLAEFVHEKIHARARGADHFGQHLLGNLWNYALRFVILAVARQKQQRARQPLLAGIEKLVDQIFFNADVASQHLGNEPVGEFVFRMEHLDHLFLVDDQDLSRCDRRGRAHTQYLSS